MAFVFFSKHFLSCRRCSYLPIPISISITVFSPLSSSSSSHSINTHVGVISELLLNECGLCSSQIAKVLTARPGLLQAASARTAREAIQLLRDSGFTENQLKSTIVRNPTIIQHKVDGRLKLKLEFMKTLGFTQQGLAKVISKEPRVLTISLENSIRPKILQLENLFGSKVNLLEALRVAPILLLTDIEKKLKPKVEYVKNNMGISEGSKTFLYALLAVLSNAPENVEKKMKTMASLGVSEEEIHQILKKFPSLLNVSMDKLQQNMHFLIHVAGLPPKRLVSNPSLVALSLEKRLKPRYEIYKSLITKPHSKGLPSLDGFFILTEASFLRKFG